MKLTASALLTLLIAASGISAQAQEQAASPPLEPKPSMMQDCGKAPIKKHDHSAERGTGPTAFKSTRAMPCEAATGAATGSSAKKPPVHDHGKVHKTP